MSTWEQSVHTAGKQNRTVSDHEDCKIRFIESVSINGLTTREKKGKCKLINGKL